jgi:phage terminase Nu1 subunit (DNA packaging protein)
MKRLNGALSFFGVMLLISCAGGLPPSLQREINDQAARLSSDEHELQQSRDTVQQELAQSPDLFAGQPETDQWMANYGIARTKLASAKADAQQLAHVKNEAVARRLLADERGLREAAETTWKAQEAAAGRWLAFQRNLPTSLENMNREYQAIHTADLTQLQKTIAQAEKDWPAKSSDLETRLAALRAIPQKADAEWTATAAARQDAAAGKAGGRQVAALIETDDLLSQQAKTLSTAPADVRALCAQLYDTWDKILTDLDESHYGGDPLYRERLKTVRTHYIDVAAKKTETHSEEHWTNVSEASFHAVQNDMGMAIAHKDAGHFDSEATTIPQPPGYSYIASPEQGSNQYGYWTHNTGGPSVWTWLPEYLILRELLWNHDYHPVVVGDYGAYRMAQRSGTSYYGQQTPNSPPKYGSHGTFTQTHYANSRYVQSGGFNGSAYASRGSSPAAAHSNPSWQGNNESGAGKRFGRQSGSPPAGQRFGRQGGGFRSPSGRGFGRRH